MMYSMAKNQILDAKFPIITKGERFTRVNDSVIFQIKGGLWRYKREGIKIEFYSRLGAVGYAVAYYMNEHPDQFKVLDDKLAKHKNDCMFHKHHLGNLEIYFRAQDDILENKFLCLILQT